MLKWLIGKQMDHILLFRGGVIMKGSTGSDKFGSKSGCSNGVTFGRGGEIVGS